jgi:predicted transcriptional regulator
MSQASIEVYQSTFNSREGDRLKVARFLASRKTATTKDIANHIGKDHSTATARLSSLIDQGCVVDAGRRHAYTLWKWVANPREWETNARRVKAAKDIKLLEAVVDNPDFSRRLRNLARTEASDIHETVS